MQEEDSAGAADDACFHTLPSMAVVTVDCGGVRVGSGSGERASADGAVAVIAPCGGEAVAALFVCGEGVGGEGVWRWPCGGRRRQLFLGAGSWC